MRHTIEIHNVETVELWPPSAESFGGGCSREFITNKGTDAESLIVLHGADRGSLTLPGEDRADKLAEALAAAYTALEDAACALASADQNKAAEHADKALEAIDAMQQEAS